MAVRRIRGAALALLGVCGVAAVFIALHLAGVFAARPDSEDDDLAVPALEFRRIPAGFFDMGLSPHDIDQLLPTRLEPHWKVAGRPALVRRRALGYACRLSGEPPISRRHEWRRHPPSRGFENSTACAASRAC